MIHHTLRGIHRQHGRPARHAAALTTAEIKKLLATCRTRGLADLRDRTLLLLGFAGALRRRELVAVQREHLTITPEGMRLLIPRAKCDHEGRGAKLGIPLRLARRNLPGAGCGGLASYVGLRLRVSVPQDRSLRHGRDHRATSIRLAEDPGAAAGSLNADTPVARAVYDAIMSKSSVATTEPRTRNRC